MKIIQQPIRKIIFTGRQIMIMMIAILHGGLYARYTDDAESYKQNLLVVVTWTRIQVLPLHS